MKFSVITINLNNLEGFRRTYDSVVSQTFKDYEWIVIDGGSTDGSKEFIEQHKEKFAYWCSEPDKGIYNALNKGISICNGEYISCMNSGDSFYDSTTLSKVLSKTHGEDVLYGDALYDNDAQAGSELKSFPKRLTLSWMYHHAINHQATFVKSNLMKKYGFDEKYRIMADRKLWFQLYFAHCTFRHVGFPVAQYDTTGVSSKDGTLWLLELLAVREEAVPAILNKNRVLRGLYSLLF